jgi:hypothetical protein
MADTTTNVYRELQDAQDPDADVTPTDFPPPKATSENKSLDIPNSRKPAQKRPAESSTEDAVTKRQRLQAVQETQIRIQQQQLQERNDKHKNDLQQAKEDDAKFLTTMTFAEKQFILSFRRLQLLEPVLPGQMNFLMRAHMNCLQRIEAIENGKSTTK